MKTEKEIPEGWKEVELGNEEYFDIVMGQSPPSSSYNLKGNGIPFLQGNAEFGRIYPTIIKYTTNPLKKCNKGDILISVRAPVGEVNISNEDTCIGRGLGSIKVLEGSGLFYYYLLSNSKDLIKNMGQGSTFKAITATELRKINVLVPPVEEQKAIAKILSEVDEQIEMTNKIIHKVRSVKKELLIKEFNKLKDFVEIRDIFEVLSGTTPPTKNRRFWDNAEINWLTPADLGKLKGQIKIGSSLRKVSNYAIKETNLSMLPEDTIILSIRAPVGHIAITSEPSSFNQGCRGLIPKDKLSINPHYYAYFLKIKRKELENRAGQSTFKELSKQLLEKFNVPKISKEEQDELVNVISTIDRKIQFENQTKKRLEKLKRGLMQELLTGNKRVNVKKILEVQA